MLPLYANIGVIFSQCRVTLRPCFFTDHRGQPHHLTCSKGQQQGDGFETVRFAVTIHPSIGRVFQRQPDSKGTAICDDIFVVVPLQEALALVAELKRILKQDLDLDQDVPKFNCMCLATASMTIRLVRFLKTL